MKGGCPMHDVNATRPGEQSAEEVRTPSRTYDHVLRRAPGQRDVTRLRPTAWAGHIDTRREHTALSVTQSDIGRLHDYAGRGTKNPEKLTLLTAGGLSVPLRGWGWCILCSGHRPRSL